MTADEMQKQLQAVAAVEDFASSSAELVAAWSLQSVGVEVVQPILEFMEAHPELDYGMPGALVHLAERFYRRGYEEKLVDSINRRPTMVTVWMLNRLINGTADSTRRTRLVSVMRLAATHPETDEATVGFINEILD